MWSVGWECKSKGKSSWWQVPQCCHWNLSRAGPRWEMQDWHRKSWRKCLPSWVGEKREGRNSAKHRSTPYLAAEDVLCKQLLQAQKHPNLSVKEKIFISRRALSSFCIWSLSGFTRTLCVIFNLQAVTDFCSWNLRGQACERWQHESQLFFKMHFSGK